jgi:hypothetical protein
MPPLVPSVPNLREDQVRATILAGTVVGLIGVFVAVGLGFLAAGRGRETAAQLDLPDVAPPEMFDPPTPAEMRDLETVAQQEGISLEDAVASYGWRRGFSQLVGKISRQHPDSFAGAAIEQDSSTWIAFKRAIPPNVHALGTEFEREVLKPRASAARIDLVPDRDSSEHELIDQRRPQN